eukprot:TRINITY_DN75931_c0_g1_i1.p1 TRINITY_DN75931_c0_g1~~TRINITY_DN75931_c0_g1_i1.p1  ORF type:complete len:577 (-),score=34.86 TRINITY_DN75931_c0_g1_i1:90-1820(-)
MDFTRYADVDWLLEVIYIALAVLCVVTLVTRVWARTRGLPFSPTHVVFMVLLTIVTCMRALSFKQHRKVYVLLDANMSMNVISLVPMLAYSTVFSMLIFHVHVVLRTIHLAYERVLESSTVLTSPIPQRRRCRPSCRFWFMCCGKPHSTSAFGMLAINVVIWFAFFYSVAFVREQNQRTFLYCLFLPYIAVDICIAICAMITALVLRQRLGELGRLLEVRGDASALATMSRPASGVTSVAEPCLLSIGAPRVRLRTEGEEGVTQIVGCDDMQAVPSAARTSCGFSSHGSDARTGSDVVQCCLHLDLPCSCRPASVDELNSLSNSKPSTTACTDRHLHLLGKTPSATGCATSGRCQLGDADAVDSVPAVSASPRDLWEDRLGSSSLILASVRSCHLPSYLVATFPTSVFTRELSQRRIMSMPWSFRYEREDTSRTDLVDYCDSSGSVAMTSCLQATPMHSMCDMISTEDRVALRTIRAVIVGLRAMFCMLFVCVVAFALRGIMLLHCMLRYSSKFPPPYFLLYMCICEVVPYTILLILYLVPGVLAAGPWRRQGETMLESTLSPPRLHGLRRSEAAV